MTKRGWESLLLVLLLVGIAVPLTASAAPSFTDLDIAAGNLNPTDRIMVQEIQITTDSTNSIILAAATVQNLGTATSGQIDKIEIWDSGTLLGQSTDVSGLLTGITINLRGYTIAAGTTHYLKVYVTVGVAVSGGETVDLRVKFYYQIGASTYASSWVTDLAGETICKGGFDQITDTALSPSFFDPGNTGKVQISVFTDNDANGKNVYWTQTGSNTILTVENLGTATTNDIAQIKVTLRIGGDDYSTAWLTWAPASPMPIKYDQFTGLPAMIPDNSSMTVTVEMRMQGPNLLTDGRTIRTRVTVYVTEGGQPYTQTATAGTTQTIRKQGFETIAEQSTSVPSGTKETGEYLEQTITVTDKDVNSDSIIALALNVRNLGTADGSELSSIEVRTGTTTLATVSGAALANFKSGITINFTVPPTVPDDGSMTFKIYYHIGTPVPGHTLRPVVQVQGEEPPASGNKYWSGEATYPDTITLYTPGLEIVQNLTPPDGGTAYSGQRLLAQKIRVVDKDNNNENVTINLVVVKNLGTAKGNNDIVKIEVMRSDTANGPQVPMGATTDLAGLRTGGVTVSTPRNNIIVDTPTGTEAFIYIYVTIAGPEHMTAGRTLQLGTRMLHTESGVSYDKSVNGNQWTLEINHRPVCDFDYTPSKDLTYKTEITFTAKGVSDPDGDAIKSHSWSFSDGGTGTGTTVKHTFAAGGTVWAQLTVTDAKGLAGWKKKTFTVAPPPVVPVAEFGWSPKNPKVGEKVTFTDKSTTPPGTTITKWSWDFNGDSKEDSNKQKPLPYTYNAGGKYKVSLTVTNSKGRTGKVTHEITVIVPAPAASFTSSPNLPHVNDPVQFSGTANIFGATITSWNWDFGDGKTSTDQNPTHKYSRPGLYQVKLTVSASNNKTASITQWLTVLAAGEDIATHSYPNPAATTTAIAYDMPTGATTPIIHVYDIAGNLVYEHDLPAGASTYDWNLTSTSGDLLPNGLYFYVITATDASGKAIRSPIFKLLIQR